MSARTPAGRWKCHPLSAEGAGSLPTAPRVADAAEGGGGASHDSHRSPAPERAQGSSVAAVRTTALAAGVDAAPEAGRVAAEAQAAAGGHAAGGFGKIRENFQ